MQKLQSIHEVRPKSEGEVRDCLRQNRELALAAVQHSGSMLMHCSEELLRDKDDVT